MKQKEVTYYRFESEIKSFLGKLLKDPINAQPSAFLKENGFDKSKTIRVLIKRGILERNEKILTPDKSGEENVKYCVSYKVKKKDFERKMHRIHSQYFEKNVPEKKEDVNECDCGGCLGGATSTGSISDTTNGFMGYSAPMTDRVISRAILPKTKSSSKNADPTKILGKTITCEGKNKKVKNIYLTEKQMDYIINETTSLSSVADTTRGDIGYDTPLQFKTKNGKKDPSYIHYKKGGVSCERLK